MLLLNVWIDHDLQHLRRCGGVVLLLLEGVKALLLLEVRLGHVLLSVI